MNMCKTRILLIAIVLLSMTGLCQAEEDKLGINFDLTYGSRWLSKGAEVYSEDGAFHETVSLDLYGTGFGVAVTHHSSTGNKWVDKQRLDYGVFYSNSLFGDETYKTKYKVGWAYWNYYDRPKKIGNTQAWAFSFSWPNLLPAGLVPKYIAHYEYPAGSDYNNCNSAGWVHRFGLGYKLSIPELKEPLNLSAEVAYRDGMGGGTKDHDFSHATLGASMKFAITENLSFVPGIYHQISMDDSVCNRDITYCKLSMKYKF